MVPWCFQFARHRFSCLQVSPEQPVSGTVNLIKTIDDRHVSVSETVKPTKPDGDVSISDRHVAVAGTVDDRHVPVIGTVNAIKPERSVNIYDRHVPVSGSVEVIKPDGTVETYDRHVAVVDLISEFPKHSLCGSGSFYIGEKVETLSETDSLVFGETYFLLPRRFFAAPLSFAAVASLAASSGSRGGFLKTAPFEVEESLSGRPRIRVSGEFVASLMSQRRVGNAPSEVRRVGVVATARVESGRDRNVGPTERWRPRLETIGESVENGGKDRKGIVGLLFLKGNDG